MPRVRKAGEVGIMRPVDADALSPIKVEECEGYTIDYYAAGWKACIDWIKTLPTLDAVPVVRCKDCMYRGAVQCALATEYNQYRPGVDPDWFCAKGRRPKHETERR